MEINIPTNIQFSVPGRMVKNYDWESNLTPMRVCFKHAVTAVMRDEKVSTELIDETPDCYVCRNKQ